MTRDEMERHLEDHAALLRSHAAEGRWLARRTREIVIDAQKGGIPMVEIARRLGIGRATLYRHRAGS